MDVVEAMENVPKGRGDKPSEPVTIVASGEVSLFFPTVSFAHKPDGQQLILISPWFSFLSTLRI